MITQKCSEPLPAPIRQLFPLVNLRLISHLKYHLVKEKIKLATKKFNRSSSLASKHRAPQLPSLEPPKQLTRTKTMHTSMVAFEGAKTDISVSEATGSAFWPKKLRVVRKGLKEVESVQRHRKLASVSVKFKPA